MIEMIRLSQKRTCEDCRALKMDQYTNKCVLGYKYEHFVPLGSCPKPKTYNDLSECEKYYKKNN